MCHCVSLFVRVAKVRSFLGGGVTPVAGHARPGLPDDPHAVAEGGAGDQPRPVPRPPPRALQRGGERVQVHLHVVVRLGHVRHVSTVLVSPHVPTQDLSTGLIILFTTSFL